MEFIIDFNEQTGKVVELDKSFTGNMVFNNSYLDTEIKIIGKDSCTCGRLTGLDLSATTITYIENGAFFNTFYLANIILPETIVSIAMNAFRYSCINNFTIKPNLQTFDGALSMCANITRFINEGNSRFFVSDEGVYLSDKKTLVRACGNVTFGSIKHINTIERFGKYAFSRTGLEKFTATEKIAELSEGTFEECFNLFELDLVMSPATVIGAYCFKLCRVLKFLILPSRVKTISGSAFYGCSLSGVFLPSSIEKFGSECFAHQFGHTRIFYFGMKQFSDDLFKGCAVTPTVYVDSNFPYANFSTVPVKRAKLGDMFAFVKKACTNKLRRGISNNIFFVMLTYSS